MIIIRLHHEIKSSPTALVGESEIYPSQGWSKPGFDRPFGGCISDSPPKQWVTNRICHLNGHLLSTCKALATLLSMEHH